MVSWSGSDKAHLHFALDVLTAFCCPHPFSKGKVVLVRADNEARTPSFMQDERDLLQVRLVELLDLEVAKLGSVHRLFGGATTPSRDE